MRAHLTDWETPISPSQPPPAEEWDPRTLAPREVRRVPGQVVGADLMPRDADLLEQPAEAPLAEELPEPTLARIEELVDDDEGGASELIDPTDQANPVDQAAGTDPTASAVKSVAASSPEPALRRSGETLVKGQIFPHACLTISEVSEHDSRLTPTPGGSAAATNGSAATEAESTEFHESSSHEFTDDDDFATGICPSTNLEQTEQGDQESDLESLVGRWVEIGDTDAAELDWSSGDENYVTQPPKPTPPQPPRNPTPQKGG